VNVELFVVKANIFNKPRRIYQKAVVHISDGKDSQTVKDFVETLDMDRELDKLLWADAIIYIMPIMWFNMPAPDDALTGF
jgi:putative NADPH-quinone reductase